VHRPLSFDVGHLFHSTSGILDACELDAASCTEAGTDFCAWDAGTAYTNAAIACTWLDTCEGVFEDNDFAECMVRALLAYDCSASANHVVGRTRDMWDALWRAQSCADVDRIVFVGVPTCKGTGKGCTTDLLTRVDCVQDGVRPLVDSCPLWGQTCDQNGGCEGCLGCFDGGEAGACTPGTAATCSGDIATSCPAGVLETINCAQLLQQQGTCNAGPLTQSLGATSPCYVDAGADADADAGAAGCVESCNGNVVTACTRGTTLTLDCAGTIDAACAGGDGGPASCVFR
jgi:hypothetical protein